MRKTERLLAHREPLHLAIEDDETGRDRRSAGAGKSYPRFFWYLGYAVFSVVLALTALEIGSWAILSVHARFHRDAVAEVAADSPAYSGYGWAQECLSEQLSRTKLRYVYFPFRLWGVSEWHGVCMNNDASNLGPVRRTIHPANPRCASQPARSVWVMGGSTVYGTGVPDWATIPSFLSGELSKTTWCWEVVNLGVEGYATNQELIFLAELLRAGRRPAYVILYDGFNDADLGSTQPAGLTPHFDFATIRNRFDGSAGGRLDFLKRSHTWQLAVNIAHHIAPPSQVERAELKARASATLDNYEQNVRMVKTLGSEYGVTVLAFWQPALIYGQKPLVSYEQRLRDLSPRFSFQNLAPIYDEARRRSAATRDFVFLGDIFDKSREALYLDWVHLNPTGNQAAARAMAEYVAPQESGGTLANASATRR